MTYPAWDDDDLISSQFATVPVEWNSQSRLRWGTCP